MATITIGAANADDQFYRYKMPELQARVGASVLHKALRLCCPRCLFL